MRGTLDHFEIPAADSARLALFLEAVFGWRQDRADGANGPSRSGGPASSGAAGIRYRRLVAAEAGRPEPSMRVGLVQGPSATLDRAMPVVRLTGETLEACFERVTAAGGRVVREPQAIGASGRFASFEDPEGNRWGLWEPG